ncbi:MAG: hypothetical protein RR359_05890 [Bacilli bacterium]
MNIKNIKKMVGNESLICKCIVDNDYNIGIYNSLVTKMNSSNLRKILENIPYQADTKVFINRVPYIVEIDIVDSIKENEVDLNVITLSEYESRYGTWED